MPTVPDCKSDEEKIAYLHKFNSREEFYNSLNNWNVNFQRYEKAILYSGIMANALLFVAGLIYIASDSSSEDDACKDGSTAKKVRSIIPWVQVGLAASIVVIGAICKINGDRYKKAHSKGRDLSMFARDIKVWQDDPNNGQIEQNDAHSQVNSLV